jgi:tetratricopeptide (TPR) repeat protein
MQVIRKYARAAVATACLFAAVVPVRLPSTVFYPRASAQGGAGRAREEAYSANNLGVALLEQFKPKDAAGQFGRAIKLDPGLALPRINLAVALYNVPDVEGARVEAEAAAGFAPDAPQPHYVLGLIAKQQGRVEDALASFARVLKIDPRDVGANVQTGQLLAQQRKYDEATAAFRVALAEEPYNGTALYSLGTALLRAGRREEGQATLQRFQALRASGAATVVGQNYLEQGRYAEAVGSTGAEADLVERRTPEVSFRYALAQWITPRSLPAGVDAPTRATPRGRAARPAGVSRQDKGAAWRQFLSSLGRAVTLLDYDGDGRLDIFADEEEGWRLYRNEGGKFVDVSEQSGALAKAEGAGAVAGDFDNDERPDLFVFGAGSCALYRNEGGGRFADVTAAAKIPDYKYLSRSAAFVDCDHDGDLDIFVAGLADASKMKDAPGGASRWKKIESVFDLARRSPGAPNILLRNNGDGTFADVTAQAKVSGGGHAAAVVPTDYDNRRDVDLLVVNYGAAPNLFRNMRDGSFRDVAAEVGLNTTGDFTAAAAGDYNKDGFTDFYFTAESAPGLMASSDGRGRFKTSAGHSAESGATAAQFLDYDEDGLLDLVTASSRGLRVMRNVGDGWVDVTLGAASMVGGGGGRSRGGGRARGTGVSSYAPRALASADLDGDGDTDVVTRDASGWLRLMRNDGGNRNRTLRVSLAGKASNRGGVEAKIEMRAGSLRQKLETYAASPAPAPADVIFGLGRRESVDAVRVLWPSGVVQAETESAAAGEGAQTAARVMPGSLKVEELDRKPSSCPYLYTWNGERFEFITDFMGGGEMGDWVAPGLFNTPDPDEYVRIRGDQLKEKEGRYELRVTNELEEALFVDRLQLVAVSHPTGVEVFPNEGLGNPTGPDFKLYAARGARTPRAARDEHGHDVLAQLARLDRKYPDDFTLLPLRGYAAEHALTLDLGDAGRGRGGRVLLLLTGWTDYAFSSNNVAASQRGLEMKPPSLQVKDGEGKWRTVVESTGFPVGRPQTVTVDLTGKFLSESREVRILTNMRVYWDQALVDDAGADSPFVVERLEAADATLRERGFSAEVTTDGREPFAYDYARVSLSSPWKTFTGRYTRPGDVRELLLKTDDMFVVSKPGDELALSFDAAALRPLPAGWTRTFMLYADGFSKEMDINSASPHEVAPLPFHGMKRYPYAAPESYPSDEAHLDYVERYNTRVVASPLPNLSAVGR